MILMKNLKFKLKFNKILKFKFKFLPKIISNYFYFGSWSVCEISSEFIEKWLFYKDFRFFFTFSLIGFGATINRPIQLHVKRQNSSICKFFQDIAWTFFCLWVARSVIHLSKKVKRQPTLINLVFSAFYVLWGTVKKSGLKSDPRQTLPGECAGESVTK